MALVDAMNKCAGSEWYARIVSVIRTPEKSKIRGSTASVQLNDSDNSSFRCASISW